jgi:PAS domain S-box-containing protein
MVRGEDGRPWFIHGVGFDVTDLKTAEAALQGERNLLTAILDTVGAVVVVLAPDGSIIRFNRAGEMLSGYSFRQAKGRFFWELFPSMEESERCRALLAGLQPGQDPSEYEADWVARDGSRRRIAWSSSPAAAPHRAISSPPASMSPSESAWRRPCSRSAPGSSVRSARTSTMVWASTSPASRS